MTRLCAAANPSFAAASATNFPIRCFFQTYGATAAPRKPLDSNHNKPDSGVSNIAGANSMASTFAGTERFDMGRVVSRATGAIGRSPAVFLGLTAALTILPALLVIVLRNASPPSDPITAATSTLFWSFALIIPGYVMMAAVTHATVVDLKNGQPSFGDSVKVGFRVVLPLIGLAIIQTFGVMIGLVLLVIPGIILAIMWSVALPALVEERRGVFASLGRSSELTKGSRWAILGFLIVAIICIFVPALLIPVLTGALDDPLAATRLSFANVIGQILTGLASMVVYVGLAAIYIELRFVKEGTSAETIAAIFD